VVLASVVLASVVLASVVPSSRATRVVPASVMPMRGCVGGWSGSLGAAGGDRERSGGQHGRQRAHNDFACGGASHRVSGSD
jgi:hypothetical protein